MNLNIKNTSRSDITVNGTIIHWHQISSEAQNHPSAKGQWSKAWTSAARALIVRELLLQTAQNLGLKPDPIEIYPGYLESDEESIIRQIMEYSIRPAEIHEDDLLAIYNAQPERFFSPPLWDVSHIVFPSSHSHEDTDDPARMAAEETISELKINPKLFENLASERSQCSSKESRGHLGQIGPGETAPEFEASLRQMKAGDISDKPVETQFGFHIIKLNAVAKGHLLPFPTILPRLREAAEKVAWIKASQDFTRSLLTGADITGIDTHLLVQ